MAQCTNCGKDFNGKYCGECGQKKFDSQQLAVVPYFKNAIKISHILILRYSKICPTWFSAQVILQTSSVPERSTVILNPLLYLYG
ncbi:MAG: hypothetical protein WKF35_06790 [Ferruginibacter sp.]